MGEVLVVIVAWNSGDTIAQAVRSIPKGASVVVVDNASIDGSVSIAEEAGARVIRLESNIGFGPACNRGALEDGGASRSILFLNPDAALCGGGPALERLMSALDGDARLGAVAPALVGPGQDRFQLRRFPSLGSLLREASLVNRIAPNNRGLLHERYLDADRTVPFEVEQPAAAALLVKRNVYEELGGFDPAFAPAWFEDVDLCARIWKSGRTIAYLPSVEATHIGGTTMEALPYRDFLPLYTRNLFRYLARHVSPQKRALARLVVGAGALLRLSLLAVTRGNHGRRDAAQAYLRVLRGILGLGWRTALDVTVRG
jgi:N-acetylglucosaminyl-diphospho-decaprenol L-rhamnosyltransferase